jgi:hypothetical protein
VEDDRKVRVFTCDSHGMCERTDPGAHLLSLLLHMKLQASCGFESKIGAATHYSTMYHAMVCARRFYADYSGTNIGLIPVLPRWRMLSTFSLNQRPATPVHSRHSRSAHCLCAIRDRHGTAIIPASCRRMVCRSSCYTTPRNLHNWCSGRQDPKQQSQDRHVNVP